MVRRSEAALGVAIREGQERGEIETHDDARRRGVAIREAKRKGRHVIVGHNDMPKPTDYATDPSL